MNEVIKNIISRRSVRKFIADRQIPESDLNLILEAAKSAPSGMNAQSWHFTVIQNKQKIEKLNSLIIESAMQSADEEMKKTLSRQKLNYFYNAPSVIIVSNEPKSSSSSTPEYDSAAALQNIFLAAHSLGIGSCWIQILSFIDESASLRDYLKELGVPKNYRVYGTAIIGYPDGEIKTEITKKDGTVNIVK
ncbi:MAG: nitroreductase family protein [Spirochaetales bacterium]|nr:nitroreductase family protein [Spirochaetales bacterium]